MGKKGRNKTMTFKEWKKEQDEIWMKGQRECELLPEFVRKSNRPYYGAIGGGLSNKKIVDKDGSVKSYVIHATQAEYDSGPDKLNEYEIEILNKIHKDGHRYEVVSTGTSIGLFVNVKDLDTGEEADNYDDI